MKKNIVKSLYSFGTAVLAFGTLATASMPIVSATTVSSSQEAAVSQVVASSKSKSSLQNSQMSSRVLTTVASSKAMSQPSASSSTVEGSQASQTSASNASVAHQSSVAQHSMKVMHLAASASSEEGPYVISGTMPTPATADDGWEVTQGPDHDGEIVYCYDPDNYNPEANGINGNPLVEDPAGGVHYNRSDLWNGSEADGYSAASVDKVAAVLYAGYPNNIGGSQHNGPISQAQVDQWYQQYLAKNKLSSSQYSEAQYEYDMTQDAIWGVEGNVPGDNVADSQWSKQYQEDPLSRALYNYAQQHPLDSQNAAKNGVTLENAQGQPIDANDTLTVDPSTHESEGFQVKGGDVTLPSSMNGYKVVNAQGQAVSTLEPGETYHVVFEPSTDPTKINMLCPYLHVATADYYHSNEAEGTMTYGPDKGQKKPWQNMVGLETNMASLNIMFAMSSSQSSSSSSKSSSSSSVVSSSKKSSSSAKSSSVVSSSKKSSSSAKSSSIASSKKSSSSVKSSSVASSKKATATTSSETTKNSSSKATKTTSSVASAKKTSSSVSTKVATSSSNNTTSAKKGVVAGVANHSSNSGKGTGHGQGQGEGHGMPQTGEAVATSLIAAGVVLLAAAGAITLRKRN
ncbi:LPXTG cell wall anchor domain-containing protein [Ligilactobacillus aviarius]|uniref:LPXTG cell wall anchor domain-containing protein n=1 Tax=Ligilactobacillus aviarius TaxID=1606 RepID=UPI0024B9F311|nr:LPXTG cell wall anchor domain-containing protein [Ligilactobacillus aviarius]